jgi:large subunit ribosomal protein L19
MEKIKIIESRFAKKDMPKINVGDTVKVLTRIPEGPDKFRLHPFEGIIIAKEGSGVSERFTVRKVSYGEGIERVFPTHSPSIERIEILRSGKVNKAKLYYLRDKVGKRATKIDSLEPKAQ